MAKELKAEINLVEGDFKLSEKETSIIREKFQNLQDIRRIRIYRTNKKPKVQYDFGEIKISGEASKRLNSWENFVNRIQDLIASMPNSILISVDTKFLSGQIHRIMDLLLN